MDYILFIRTPGQVPDGFHRGFLLISLYNQSEPGKEGGEGEGEHDGGDGVGEHEAEHQAGVRVLQDVSVLRNEDADDDDVDFNDGDQKAERAKKLICEDWNLVS